MGAPRGAGAEIKFTLLEKGSSRAAIAQARLNRIPCTDQKDQRLKSEARELPLKRGTAMLGVLSVRVHSCWVTKDSLRCALNDVCAQQTCDAFVGDVNIVHGVVDEAGFTCSEEDAPEVMRAEALAGATGELAEVSVGVGHWRGTLIAMR